MQGIHRQITHKVAHLKIYNKGQHLEQLHQRHQLPQLL